jgi:hypothetical protein
MLGYSKAAANSKFPWYLDLNWEGDNDEQDFRKRYT